MNKSYICEIEYLKPAFSYQTTKAIIKVSDWSSVYRLRNLLNGSTGFHVDVYFDPYEQLEFDFIKQWQLSKSSIL